MKRLILMCGLLASGFSFGADWVFVAENQDGDTDHYIDSSYYNYSAKTGVSRVWYKVNKFNGLDEYTHKKAQDFGEQGFDVVNITHKETLDL